MLDVNLRKKFKSADVWVTDSKTYFLEYKDVEKILKLNMFKYIKYKADIFDCENYAFSLYALVKLLYGNVAFGVMAVTGGKTGNHSINCFLDEYMQMWAIAGFKLIKPTQFKAGYSP
jgi:hypothetical protein